MKIKGNGGAILSFDGAGIAINRRVPLVCGTIGKGRNRIPMHSITAIQFKPAGPMINGFIQFTVAGGGEKKSRMGRQTADAVRDENSVIFTRGQRKEFEEFRDAIQAAMDALHRPAAAAAAAPDVTDQLRKIGELRDAGILSEDEFAAKKAELLSRL